MSNNRENVLRQNRTLASVFFNTERRRLRDMLEGLIHENFNLGGTQHGFVYRSNHYTLLHPKQARSLTLGYVDPSLSSKVDVYVAYLSSMNKAEKSLTFSLDSITLACSTEQDLRDALPDPIVELTSNLKTLPRTRPEDWIIADKPKLAQQFQALGDVVYGFYAHRFLF